MLKIAGCSGIVFGIFAILLSVIYILIGAPVVVWFLEQPIIGNWIVELVDQIIYFPKAEFAFILLGIFALFWGFALIQKQSWARMIGAVLYGLAVFYTVALLIVLVPLDELESDRWWILAVGVGMTCFFAYTFYNLLFNQNTQWAFAKPYYDRQDFDLPPQRAAESSVDISTLTKPLSQDKKAPELARLIPASGDGEPFIIRERRTIVGRIESHLVLDPKDTSISRKHATIFFDEEQFVLEDSSRNGTVVNGERIKNDKVPLPDGAEILFGRREAKFIFKYAQPSEEPAPQEAASVPTVLARLQPLWTEGQAFDIIKPKVVIGRDPKASDLALPPQEDRSVSSQHAEIEYTDQGKFILRDLDSSNGTYVDDTRITETELTEGAEIRLGLHNTRFKFQKETFGE